MILPVFFLLVATCRLLGLFLGLLVFFLDLDLDLVCVRVRVFDLDLFFLQGSLELTVN